MPYIKKYYPPCSQHFILSLLLSHPRLSADGAQKGLLFMVQYGLSDVISIYALLKAFS